MFAIHELATITSKGQITLPKPVRQTLGVAAGGKIAFDLHENGQITVSRAEAGQHEDPAIGAFVELLAADIRAGRHLRGLPDALAQAMLERAARSNGAEQADDAIEGDVVI